PHQWYRWDVLFSMSRTFGQRSLRALPVARSPHERQAGVSIMFVQRLGRWAHAFIAVALIALPAVSAEFIPYENFPSPAPGAFGVTGTALPDGRLLVWNGGTLYRQTGVDADAFDAIATGYAG